jgi:RNA polymerase sigma-70 factor (ECF subfamily)
MIAAAQRGDARAFSDLVSLHRDGVVRVVYRMCGDPGLAEEAAQEAFLRVWQHMAEYQPGRPFRAWVYRIAVNAALDALRREKPQADLDSIAETQPAPRSAQGDPEGALEDRQRAEQVQRAVMKLPDASRAVLVLREYGDLSYVEIAGALHIPLGTVMSRLNSARGQLRKSLVSLMEVL